MVSCKEEQGVEVSVVDLTLLYSFPDACAILDGVGVARQVWALPALENLENVWSAQAEVDAQFLRPAGENRTLPSVVRLKTPL